MKRQLSMGMLFARSALGRTVAVLAAMAAQGVSEIDDIHHIDRGYEDLAEILPTVGVRISRVG